MKRQPKKYAPEIEARRKEYEKLAEGLIILLGAHGNNVIETLDVEAPGWVEPEPDNGILWFGIQDHLKALFENLTVVYDNEFLRTLYVELRLFYDQKMLETLSGPFSFRKGRGR